MLPCKVLLTLTSVVWANIIGVAPEKQSLYVTDEHGRWHCLLDPSIELLFEQINDDICDCPDGSDEPGTNACPFTGEAPKYFYCANEGYREAYIENYKLNDGVCDYDICCDGSDEYKSGACPNLCDQVQSQFEVYLHARKAAVKEALKIKNELIEKAQRLKQNLERSAQTLKVKIAQDEGRLMSLKKELNQNASESDESTESISFMFDKFILEYTRKLEEKFMLYERNSLQASENVRSLEAMLQNLLQNYNPNFNDQAVKQTISNFADYISNKPEDKNTAKLDLPRLSLDDMSQNLREAIVASQEHSSNAKSSVSQWFLDRYRTLLGINDKISCLGDKRASALQMSDKTEKLLKSISELEKNLEQKKSEEAIYEDGLNADYGEADIYRSVKGVWTHKKIGEYSYKLGFLDSLYQDNTLVGRFHAIHGNSMFFAHGSKCWNGPQRTAQVDMICAPHHELISVSEPEKCQYRFLMNSPLACNEMADDELAQQFTVDQAKLKL